MNPFVIPASTDVPRPSDDILKINPRILIVDDNPAIHEDFRKILSPSDYGEADLSATESVVFGEQGTPTRMPDFQVAFAAQGEGAVKLVEMGLQQERPFAVAMVDVRMPPGMDGIETIKAMWRIQPDLQVAICTAYSDYSWDEIIDHLGVTHRLVILKKPFDPIEVIQLANALTSKWSHERDLALRQLELQSKLWDTNRRVEEGHVKLRQEQEQRLRLEEGLYQMQRVDSIGGLAAGIAHDFNNVLTVIQSQLSMTLMQMEDRPAIGKSLEEVLVAARRAADLTRQLLSFSGREYQACCPLQLEAALQADIATLRRTLGKHITIEASFARDLPEVMADIGSLGQIVVNLALNARDAMPKGGRLGITTRRASIRTAEEARALHPEARVGEFGVINISDTGSGISAEILPKIFDPFFTTKEPGRGTGMGLPMVRALVRHQSGWVTVSSVSGVGTDFEIYLRLAGSVDTHVPEGKHVPARDFNGLLQDLAPCTLMVVDDDDAVREVISSVLRSQGHTVLAARDAHEAWASWRTHRHVISLIVTDINLPGTASGFDLGRALASDDPTIPIIFTSGYCPDILGQTTALQLGINYIPKPFDVLDLLNSVGHALTSAAAHKLHIRRRIEMQNPQAQPEICDSALRL